MILLDTNALIWLLRDHPRTRQLARAPRLYVSPASLLELHMLIEAGRGRVVPGRSVADVVNDPRWLQDEPPAGAWFQTATDVTWTRDPFDRLIVAHARVRRWKLATGDGAIAEHLSPREVLML
ncbi:MAG TPA: PIN domain-containing protein [Vicinamibacterales bacterium]|nr:PIN domain-containing protein [Vicinamibacterales bacterium]